MSSCTIRREPAMPEQGKQEKAGKSEGKQSEESEEGEEKPRGSKASANGLTALALVQEQAQLTPCDGGIHVHIGEDDVCTLPSQLKGNTLQVRLTSHALDVIAHLCAPSESNLVYALMACKGSPSSRAEAREDVQDASRVACLRSKLCNAQCCERGLQEGGKGEGTNEVFQTRYKWGRGSMVRVRPFNAPVQPAS
jgi:hypothetical protein